MIFLQFPNVTATMSTPHGPVPFCQQGSGFIMKVRFTEAEIEYIIKNKEAYLLSIPLDKSRPPLIELYTREIFTHEDKEVEGQGNY